jgi:hypothetical protein
MPILENKYCLQIIETGFTEQFLGLSRDGACTDLFENLSMNSLKGDLLNGTTFKPPLFSLVNTFKIVYFHVVHVFFYFVTFFENICAVLFSRIFLLPCDFLCADTPPEDLPPLGDEEFDEEEDDDIDDKSEDSKNSQA